MKKLNPIKEKLLDKIIKVAYGEGNLWEIISVHYLSKRNPDVQKMLEEYKETATAVKSIRSEECPDNIVKIISKKLSGEKYSSGFAATLFEIFLRKPVIVPAVVLVIGCMLTIFIIKQERDRDYYSDAKVEQAEKQVKESLALVGKIFKETQNTVKDDVFEKKVSPPIKESMEVINNLFKRG